MSIGEQVYRCTWMYNSTSIQVYKCIGAQMYRCTSVYECTGIGVHIYGCTGVQVYECTEMYSCICEKCYFTLKCKNKDVISKHSLPI